MLLIIYYELSQTEIKDGHKIQHHVLISKPENIYLTIFYKK